jgi:hypothetical protein
MLLELTGSHINSFPFSDLKRIKNLLSFEGTAVLIHYANDVNKDFLYYWVDYHGDNSRWLLWQVAKSNLFEYLRGGRTLRDLVIGSDKSEYRFIIETNSSNEFVDGVITIANNVQHEYLPDEDSFYSYPMPEIYDEYFQEFNYLALMRDNALYFTLEPLGNEYGHSVLSKDAATFLENINKSYTEYSEYSFNEKFKNTTSDLKRLRKNFTALSESRALRICDMSFNSFNVALCTDVLNRHPEIDKKFTEWSKELVENYKNDVIDYNFSSEEDAKIIAEKFPDPILRKKIFEPVIKIIENENTVLKVNSFDKTFKKKYEKLKEHTREIIIEKPSLEDELASKNSFKKIVQVYIEVSSQENIGDKALSKKSLKENLLFAQETKGFPIVIDEVTHKNRRFELNNPLLLHAVLNNGIYELSLDALRIAINSEDKDELLTRFNNAFGENYDMAISSKEDVKLAEEFKVIVKRIV